MELICMSVITSKKGVLIGNDLFVGKDEDEVKDRAEKHFLRLCKNHCPTFGKYDEEDQQWFIDDGWFKYMGIKIYIEIPMVFANQFEVKG